jgi:hypothetical protein
MLETLFVNQFEQPWPQCPMDANGVTNDSFYEGAEDNCHRESAVQEPNRLAEPFDRHQSEKCRSFFTHNRLDQSKKSQVISWRF